MFYTFLLKTTLNIVVTITVIGIDKKMPGVPSTDILAHIENSIQNGCIPSLSPMSFGVMKLESKNGTMRYNPIVIQYWYKNEKSSTLIAKVIANPIQGPKNGAIEINPENIPHITYSLVPMIRRAMAYIIDNIQHTNNCPLMYSPSLLLILINNSIHLLDVKFFNTIIKYFSNLFQSFNK